MEKRPLPSPCSIPTCGAPCLPASRRIVPLPTLEVRAAKHVVLGHAVKGASTPAGDRPMNTDDAIATGRTGRFSIDRLVRCLDRLGCAVEVTVRPRSPSPGTAALA